MGMGFAAARAALLMLLYSCCSVALLLLMIRRSRSSLRAVRPLSPAYGPAARRTNLSGGNELNCDAALQRQSLNINCRYPTVSASPDGFVQLRPAVCAPRFGACPPTRKTLPRTCPPHASLRLSASIATLHYTHRGSIHARGDKQ
jgi:hypothetical protein